MRPGSKAARLWFAECLVRNGNLFSPVYKLCDFGAARKLKENEQHTSMVGTEEYLVNQKALHDDIACAFGHTVFVTDY